MDTMTSTVLSLLDDLPGALRRLVLCALAGAVLAGCAHTANYDASYLAAARRPANQVNEGKALVETTSEEDAYVYTGPPTSMTGAAHTLSVPLGAITKEAAKPCTQIDSREAPMQRTASTVRAGTG